MISLSGAETQRDYQQSPVWLSFGLHVLGCAAIYSGMHSPRITARPAPETHFVTRSIEFEPAKASQPQQASSGEGAARNPGSGTPSASAMQVPFDAPQQPQVLQTLIQPDLPKQVQLAKTPPIPQLLMWAPASVAVTKLAPPPPQKELPKLENRPALAPPRERLPIANLRMASTDLQSEMKNMTASNVSPVVIHGEVQIDMISETPAKQQLQPVQASVISVSEVKLPQGRTEIPPSNQIASAPLHGGLQPGPQHSQHPGSQGLSIDTGTHPDRGTASIEPGHSESAGAGGKSDSGINTQKAGEDLGSGLSKSSSAAATQGVAGTGVRNPGWTQLTRPKDGRFSVVVVGSSQAEDYPESAQIWKGRLAYTVFLNVGSAKKWILQFSLPPDSPSGGTRIDAPWPYELSVPLDAGAHREAVMVHGLLQSTGHLDQLTMVLPASSAALPGLMQALTTWSFRPAVIQGKAVNVEVLLIIPEDDD